MSRLVAATIPVVAALAACAGGSGRAAPAGAPAPAARAAMSPAEKARADNGRPPYTRADVQFMAGMIGHHSQAVLMAGWAPTHGASPALRIFCERIIVAQQDEIDFSQRWLRDRGEAVPSGDPAHHAMAGMPAMAGMDHGPAMPGMLTAAQLAQLDSARGPAFDRLFLTSMIKHHEGALTMVEQLFAARGAGQDDAIFKFASDVQADQTTEIERMTSMLEALGSGAASR